MAPTDRGSTHSSAASIREMHKTAAPGAAMLKTFTARNSPVSPISSRKRGRAPMAAVCGSRPRQRISFQNYSILFAYTAFP
ncbi:hypothetical protein [Dysosmobacter sp.]